MIDGRELRVDLGDAGVLAIPYVNVIGEAGEGPHLTEIAGVHGTEYTSIAAARELLAELRPAELSGTVTVAPLINLPAFWASCSTTRRRSSGRRASSPWPTASGTWCGSRPTAGP